jgi:heptosyltransferase-2
MKILVIALSGIGDALMFSPALNLLKHSIPDSEIDMLVMFKGSKDIFRYNPNISKLLHFDFMSQGFINSLRFILELRKNYDITINVYPSNRKEYNIINFIIGAKKRVAVRYKRMFAKNFGWLNNILIDENDETHNVETNVRMIEKLLNQKFIDIPPMEIFLSADEEIFSKRYLENLKIDIDDFVIGIHPGCATLKNHIKRRWEPEKFIEISKRLISEFNVKILLFGGSEEEELKLKIFNGINSNQVYIVKTASLLQSSAIMRRCNLFLTNDSALMHIASALSINVACIIGPTNIKYIYPWKTTYKVISLQLECSPCFFYSPKPLSCKRNDIKFKCIKELTVDYAFESIKDFITKIRTN